MREPGAEADELTPELILRLQRTAGNQAVLRLLHQRWRVQHPHVERPPAPPEPRSDFQTRRAEEQERREDAAERDAEREIQAETAPVPAPEPEPERRADEPRNGSRAAEEREEEREETLAPELREEAREEARDPGPGVEIEIPPEHAGVLRIVRAAQDARRSGADRVAEAVERTIRWLRTPASAPRAARDRRLLLAALEVWTATDRWWGGGRWWSRLLSLALWAATLGWRGGPWLTLSAPDYARIPHWRRKDAAFLAEVAYRTAGLVLNPPHPPEPDEWADAEHDIDGFAPVERPAPGRVWSDGSRCGVLVAVSLGEWIGLAPSLGPGEGWGEHAGLTLVRIEGDATYRRFGGSEEAGEAE